MHAVDARGSQLRAKSVLRLRLAVNERDVLQRAALFEVARVLEQILLVGVGREAVEHCDLSAQIALDAEDLHALAALDDATSERVLRLVADNADRVLLALDRRLEVMDDAPRFTHPARGDDHR